jgi:phage/plasmid primase-like uncharacterized protein
MLGRAVERYIDSIREDRDIRNITLTCPACGEPERCIGDPDESNAGHSGIWFCFNCRSHGQYAVTFVQTGDPGDTTKIGSDPVDPSEPSTPA